jgi:hypothetical protein
VTAVTDRAARAAEHGPSQPKENRIMLKTNIGGLDRAARLCAGIALLGLAATGVIGPWGYVGLVPLATGLLKSCPLYTVLGVSTCPTRS